MFSKLQQNDVLTLRRRDNFATIIDLRCLCDYDSKEHTAFRKRLPGRRIIELRERCISIISQLAGFDHH